jgi:hypothetical protein
MHTSFPFSKSTSALPKITLHDERKIAHANFHYSTSTSALPKTTTLQKEGKPTHDSFLMEEHPHQGHDLTIFLVGKGHVISIEYLFNDMSD